MRSILYSITGHSMEEGPTDGLMTEKVILLFRCLLLCLLLFSVGGCGTEEASAGKSGLFIDDSTEAFLKAEFESTKICGQFEKGAFEEVSVVMMPPTFPCKHYPNGCSGEYVNPNYLKVGSLYVWRHEVIHYLLDLNIGDPDAAHLSPLFKTCI